MEIIYNGILSLQTPINLTQLSLISTTEIPIELEQDSTRLVSHPIELKRRNFSDRLNFEVDNILS